MVAKAQERGRCIFCGGFGMSKEHFFAQWMHEYLPEVPSTHFLTDEDWAPRKGKLHRPGPLFSRHLRVVCDSCNSGWMSILQGKAKPWMIPLMQGLRKNPASNSEKTLGAWATMFSMVVECAGGPVKVVTQEQREFLRSNEAPPQSWHIWMCSLPASYCSYVQSPVGEDKPPPVSPGLVQYTDALETLIIAGRLVFHVIGFTSKAFESQYLGPLRVNARRSGLKRIWPSGKLFETPATLTLQDLRMHRARTLKTFTGKWPPL
jgi:hypothetical protein